MFGGLDNCLVTRGEKRKIRGTRKSFLNLFLGEALTFVGLG